MSEQKQSVKVRQNNARLFKRLSLVIYEDANFMYNTLCDHRKCDSLAEFVCLCVCVCSCVCVFMLSQNGRRTVRTKEATAQVYVAQRVSLGCTTIVNVRFSQGKKFNLVPLRARLEIKETGRGGGGGRARLSVANNCDAFGGRHAAVRTRLRQRTA